jgi:integrase
VIFLYHSRQIRNKVFAGIIIEEDNQSEADLGEEDADPTDEVAAAYKLRRTKENTKKAYKSKMKVFKEYLALNYPDSLRADGQVRLPIRKEPLINFFGKLFSTAHELGKLRSPEDIPAGHKAPLSISSVNGYRSAIVDLYTQNGATLPASLNQELGEILSGYEKHINELKKRGLMKLEEGKKALPMTGYRILCNAFMKDKPEGRDGGRFSTGMFMWLFMTLLWNLISRSDSVNSLMLEHFDWKDDCLLVQEQGHKADKKGKTKYWKHIYANPLEPDLCPVLALAVYLFCSAYRPSAAKHRIFDGKNDNTRFGKNLHSFIAKLSAEDRNILNGLIDNIGSHSGRKGAGSYVLGQVAGPNPVTVSLRMGHSIGNVSPHLVYVYGN